MSANTREAPATPSAIIGTCMATCWIVWDRNRTMPRKDTTTPTVMTPMPAKPMFGTDRRTMTPPTRATRT